MLQGAKFGDILAFSSRGIVGDVIRILSSGNVSHVAFVINENFIIESTMLDDNDPSNGVSIKNLNTKIQEYNGDVWHLSIRNKILNVREVYEYALNFQGLPYDMKQAVMSALDILLYSEEDFNEFYCSELCALLLRYGNILPESINPSELTPVDLCQLKLYKDCRNIKGEDDIYKFNTIEIGDLKY